MHIDNKRRPTGEPGPPATEAALRVLLGVGCAGLAATLAGVLLGGLAGILIGTAGLVATLGTAGLFGAQAVRALLPPSGR